MSFRDLGEVLLFTTTATIVKSWSSKVNVRPNEKKQRKMPGETVFHQRWLERGLIPNSIHVSSGSFLLHKYQNLTKNLPKFFEITKFEKFWQILENFSWRDSFPSEVVGKGTIDLFQIRFM